MLVINILMIVSFIFTIIGLIIAIFAYIMYKKTLEIKYAIWIRNTWMLLIIAFLLFCIGFYLYGHIIKPA